MKRPRYGLKLFLSANDVEKLNDFEEECMQKLGREKEAMLYCNTDDRIRLIGEKVGGLNYKVQDPDHELNSEREAKITSLDDRMTKLEELVLKNYKMLSEIQELIDFQVIDKIPNATENVNRMYRNIELNSAVLLNCYAQPKCRIPHLGSQLKAEKYQLDHPPQSVDPQDLSMLHNMEIVGERGMSTSAVNSGQPRHSDNSVKVSDDVVFLRPILIIFFPRAR